jgi:microcystin-dependent protein
VAALKAVPLSSDIQDLFTCLGMFDVVPDGAYKFSAYAKTSAGSYLVRPAIVWVTDAGARSIETGPVMRLYVDNSGWVQITFTAKVPAGKTHMLCLLAWTPVAGRDLYIDDVSVIRVTSYHGGYISADYIQSATDIMDATGYLIPPGTPIPWFGPIDGTGAGGGVFGQSGSSGGVGAAGGTGGGGGLPTVILGVPPGLVPGDGRAISRTTWWRLFTIFGTRFGIGDGSTTFNVPDVRGCALIGLDNLGGTDRGLLDFANTLGAFIGAEYHTHGLSDNGQAQVRVITGASGALHVRQIGMPNWNSNAAEAMTPSGGGASLSSGAALRGATDGGSTIPPALLCNWLIKG